MAQKKLSHCPDLASADDLAAHPGLVCFLSAILLSGLFAAGGVSRVLFVGSEGLG